MELNTTAPTGVSYVPFSAVEAAGATKDNPDTGQKSDITAKSDEPAILISVEDRTRIGNLIEVKPGFDEDSTSQATGGGLIAGDLKTHSEGPATTSVEPVAGEPITGEPATGKSEPGGSELPRYTGPAGEYGQWKLRLLEQLKGNRGIGQVRRHLTNGAAISKIAQGGNDALRARLEAERDQLTGKQNNAIEAKQISAELRAQLTSDIQAFLSQDPGVLPTDTTTTTLETVKRVFDVAGSATKVDTTA